MDTSFLARSKGLRHLTWRFWTIVRFYGLKPTRMIRELERLVTVIEAHGGRTTLLIPAVTLARQPAVARSLQARGVELAVHGWTHIPLDRLPADEQLAHLHRAQDVFGAVGIPTVGFRAPYLRRNDDLLASVEAAGFAYVSNQSMIWDALEAKAFPSTKYATYQRAIAFYQPWQASEQPSLPQLHNQLVEIPVSLPDDEMLCDRLGGSNDLVEKVWRRILVESYRRGELFTVNLHPERTAKCVDGLAKVLAEACRFTPSVWFARLDEIAAWWRARARATVEITDTADGGLDLVVTGPDGATALVRTADVNVPSMPWADGYRKVLATTFTVYAPLRPFIGLSPDASPMLASFLRQQGYIVETSEDSRCYSYYFDQARFTAECQRPLLAQIEETARPLVRLGRWPSGAHSALAVTGDIDALTLWDYGLRLLSR